VARFVLRAAGMRMLVVASVFLLACGGDGLEVADGEECPASVIDGDACSYAGRCWQVNEFSPCLSGWCTCENGHVICDALAPRSGEGCGDEPITSCGYEGTLSCDIPPTREACSCTEDGTWLCTCACYGPTSYCGCPDDRPLDQIEGLPCGDVGEMCTYPTGTCTCAQGGDQNRFDCTP